MQFIVQLSDIQDPRKPVLVQQNKVRLVFYTEYLYNIYNQDVYILTKQCGYIKVLQTALIISIFVHRRCLQTIRRLEHKVFVTQKQMEARLDG